MGQRADRYGRRDAPYHGTGVSGKIHHGKRKERKFSMLFNTMLFIGFIALNIASSSVTIRVEMRWIYVSLAGALLFLSYIYGELTEGVKKELYLKRLYPWGILFALYVLLMLPAELFYRSCYPNCICGRISCAIIH